MCTKLDCELNTEGPSLRGAPRIDAAYHLRAHGQENRARHCMPGSLMDSGAAGSESSPPPP